MGKWFVYEKSIYDKKLNKEIIEVPKWHMINQLQKIYVEYNYNKIYKNFVQILCEILLKEIDKDSYCKMAVSE